MHVSELSGQTVGDGKYRLLLRLGNGNFGTVYRAQELMGGKLVREVALKLYSPEATRSGNVEGMLQDCALPARIMASDAPIEQKRHFVSIYSFGKMDTPAGECAYVAMELVRGGDTLEDIIKRCKRAKHFPRESVIVDLMTQFFTALSLAHKENVLHRDIKGANVMVQNGVVRVMDFGMGADLDKPDTPLKTTMSIYAPENFDGRYTAASDIYQAGLMFYELYTGCSPFADRFGAGSMLEERKKRSDFVFKPGAAYPGTDPSPRLDEILSRCLRFSELARYQSADEVLGALKGAGSADALRMALVEEDFPAAEKLAREALSGTRIDDEERIGFLKSLGKALAGQERIGEALETYGEALDLAERSGVFFHKPSKYNEIIDAMCVLYLKNGQAGTARLFSRKKR
ncbi:MAG: serine/threonine-protein kinase [Eubacteriales bacterium]|nr:serine/threonine-protein kinase [Eubacteriales bacterium]